VDLAKLKENEQELRRALLPSDLDVTKALSGRDQFLTHAYLVLSYAVLEEFVEECFRQYVTTAAAAAPKEYDGCFVTLAFKFADTVIGQNKGALPISADAILVLKNLYESKIVTSNNGIRRRNFEAMAKPIGLHPKLEEDCEGLLSAADALGSKRGAIAHVGTISEEIRPSEAEKLVTDVISNVSKLIALLNI
jgi:hypothetical protein